MKKKIMGATLGNCVHVAGVMNYFNLAENENFETEFVGIGLSSEELKDIIIEKNPDIVAVSYRLTPEPLHKILEDLKKNIEENNELKNLQWEFGGTEPTALIANEYNIFDKIFYSTEDIDEVIGYLKGREDSIEENYPKNLVDRVNSKYPYQLLRHHLGLTSIAETVDAIETISEAKVLDVISVAPDQNAQEFFFDQENMDESLSGAGGVPVRKPEDFRTLYQAAQRGNQPLLRSYSGTKNLIPFAGVLKENLDNAWCAVPLFWYSELDKRGPRTLDVAIRENQELMKWHGERNIPVEINDAHHWSLRDSHDAIGVAVAYIVAHNAKKMGVKNYISQFMFNVPAHISAEKDLGKMLAKIELMDSLIDDDFTIFRQARAGLASFPSDLEQAKGQLAASAYLAMAIKPHIYHVVGFCEAHHAATAEDVIESAKIVRGIIKNEFLGSIDLTRDVNVQKRKSELVEEAKIIIEAIEEIGKNSEDPLSDPEVLVEAVRIGILDAPQLKGNRIAKGELTTRMVSGGLYAYDTKEGRIIPERERIDNILKAYNYSK